MKLFTIFSTLFLLSPIYSSLIERFRSWTLQFNIIIKNEEHEHILFEKWIINDKYIDLFNNANHSFTLGHNQFSGMNSEEFRNYLGYYKKNIEKDSSKMNNDVFVSFPKSINWVEKGAVTSVKDQGQCGSCWTFSTTGALEGAYFLKFGNLVSFSEQQLVDCDNFKNNGKDHGCNGGLMDNAFTWIHNNGGLCSEEEYPYTSGNGKSGICQKKCNIIDGSDITSFNDVIPNSDNAMMYALSQQPVSIAIEADQKEFQFYKSGVFTASCGTNLDHGVLAVGYGTNENNEDYYIVKNSWSSTWGQNGYIYLARGSSYNNGAGQCGMLMEGSYPIL